MRRVALSKPPSVPYAGVCLHTGCCTRRGNRDGAPARSQPVPRRHGQWRAYFLWNTPEFPRLDAVLQRRRVPLIPPPPSLNETSGTGLLP